MVFSFTWRAAKSQFNEEQRPHLSSLIVPWASKEEKCTKLSPSQSIRQALQWVASCFRPICPVRWRETVATGLVVIPSTKTPSPRPFSTARLIQAGCIVLLSLGCAWHLDVPSQGELLPSPVKLESSPFIPTTVSLSKLRFKALLLDENGNLFLESGERIRVHVDVVNTGSSPIQNASASLTGTPSVIGQFPSTTQTIPPLQPGETKALDFAATLPSSLQPQQVEIRVAVTEAGGAAARPQALLFIIQPADAGAGGVDQIPPLVLDFHHPQTYANNDGQILCYA